MNISSSLWISCSMLIALCLMLLPVPEWAEFARPEWLLMAIIYWVLAVPQRVSVGVAWMLGLLLDTCYGDLLGLHALIFAIVAYITAKLHRRVRLFPVWQQAVFVGAMVLLAQLTLFLIRGVIGQLPHPVWFWLPILTSMLFWPWMYYVLMDWQRRFRVC